MELIDLSTQHIPDLLKIEGKVFDPSWGVEAITQCFNADSLNVGVKYEDSEEHARLVGYLLASIKLDEIWILRIATDEVYRGLGCATYLLRHVFQYGRAHQMNRLTLEVRADNDAAIALYEKCGFSVDGRRERYYHSNGEYEDALLMTCVIDNS